MDTICEKCGASTRPPSTASRVFCESCAAQAATGARSSNELLFTLRARARESVERLDSLVRTAEAGERISLWRFVKIGPPIHPPLVRSVRIAKLLPWTALCLSILLFATSAALAMRAASVEPKPETILKSTGELAVEPPPPAPEPFIPRARPARQAPPPAVVESAPRIQASAERAAPIAARPSRRQVEAEVSVFDELAPPLPPAPVRPDLPTLPTRAAVRIAMTALSARVERCSDEPRGMVQTRVTFLGESGRAASVQVVDSTLPAEMRSCIAEALEDAELPPFAQERFTVAFPYRF